MTAVSTRAPRSRQAGFTLIEVLIATTISATIMGSIVLVTSQLSRSYYSQLDGAAVQQEGRFALDWVISTLLTAGNNPQLLTTSPCPTAATPFRAIQRNPNAAAAQNNIRIHSDMNGNGALGGLSTGTGTCIEPDEDITIALAANTITKKDNNTGQAAAALDMTDTVITGLTFEYFDCSRTATTNDSAVCFIRVTVTSQTPTINISNGLRTTYTNTAEVRLRAR